MRRRITCATAVWVVLASAATSARSGEAPGGSVPDVRHYDLDVGLADTTLTANVTIHATAAKAPKRWTLDLAPQMKVVSARCGERDLSVAAKDWSVEVDLSGAPIADGAEFALTLRVEGAPLEENKRLGFVRSAVRADAAYIRSQYPWYPRAQGDLATYRTKVDAPETWLVCTAGTAAEPVRAAGRVAWNFERSAAVDRIGLAAAPYVRVEASGEGAAAVTAYVWPGRERAAEGLVQVARAALASYTSRFGPAQDSRWTLVEVPKEFGAGSGYGEAGYVLLGSSAFATEGAEWTREFVAHEIAHGWWGNTVRFADFGNEALANWSAMTFLAETAGPSAAADMRKLAVKRVADLGKSGKEIALRELKGFGEGAAPGVYAALAYEKSLMLLVMVEQRLGSDGLQKKLAAFSAADRTEAADWNGLRRALSAGSPEVAALLDAWDAPGVPTLRLDFQSKKAGAKWTVTGKVTQEGISKPRPMWVPVVATCGEKSFATTVALKGASATFTLATPAEPDAVLLDPDCVVLALKPGAAKATLAWEEIFAIVNNPRDDDAARCADALASLRALLDAGTATSEGQAWVGIGRLLFRTGEHDEAKSAFEKALKMGGFGPFNRSWAMLRLGCIADLSKKRDDAVAHYKAVVELRGADEFVVKLAKRWLDRAYRGYRDDG